MRPPLHNFHVSLRRSLAAVMVAPGAVALVTVGYGQFRTPGAVHGLKTRAG
jgi:hypothetical protein